MPTIFYIKLAFAIFVFFLVSTKTQERKLICSYTKEVVYGVKPKAIGTSDVVVLSLVC